MHAFPQRGTSIHCDGNADGDCHFVVVDEEQEEEEDDDDGNWAEVDEE